MSTSKTEELWIRLVDCAEVNNPIVGLQFCKRLTLGETGPSVQGSHYIISHNNLWTYSNLKILKKKPKSTHLKILGMLDKCIMYIYTCVYILGT